MALAASAVTAACGGAAVQGPTVRAVEIAGNEEVSDDQLLSGLATRPPAGLFGRDKTGYDPVSLRLDEQRIVSYYRRKGFYAARVIDTEVTRAELDDEEIVAVTIVVDEGAPTTVSSVVVRGAPDEASVDRAALEDALGIEGGDRFEHPSYSKGKSRVRQRLVESGYLRAKVAGSVEIDRDTADARIVLDVTPGPVTYFGATAIRGLERVPESAVRHRITWEEGERFDPEELSRTQARLYQLGYFGTVGFDYAQGPADGTSSPDAADVTVDLAEANRHQIRLGGGVGVDRINYEVRGRASYTEKGFWGPLTTLNLRARPAYRILKGALRERSLGGEASAGLSRDDFLAPLVRGDTELAYVVQDLEAYSIQGPRARASVVRPFADDRLLLGAGYQARVAFDLDVDEAIGADSRAALGLDGDYRLAFFDQSIAYDVRDDPLSPTEGLYLQLKLEEAGAYAGSAFEYVRVTPEARFYLPIGDRLVLAARSRAGGLLSGQGALPITRRYFSGGATSQRGFSERRLAPALAEGDRRIPIGGEALLEGNIEGRLDVAKLAGNWLGIVAFLDGADVTERFSDLDPANLHLAAGGGLRYHTPVGPVRFDLGVRVTRRDEIPQEAGFAFHLSLGEAF